MKNNIKIGSRGSMLATTQTRWYGDQLLKKFPDLSITYVTIKTTGDKDMSSSLSAMGGKGVFVKEIEEALLSKEIDIAVHSLKDVPQELPSGLILAPCPAREDPRDVLISRFGELLRELPRGSEIGTGSPRRSAQIKFSYQAKYRISPIRGNIETRLKKLEDGKYDAVVMAFAGLKRLGLESSITQIIEPEELLPAPCQGCLGIEVRAGDEEVYSKALSVSHAPSDLTAQAERAFLQGIGGDCLVPLGGLARIEGDNLTMKGCVLDIEGKNRVICEEKGSMSNPLLVGFSLAERLLAEGGSALLVGLDLNQG